MPRFGRWLLVALYPASFGISYVLLSFAEFPTPSSDLIRPIIVVVLGTLAVGSVLLFLFRGSPWVGIVLSAVIVATSAPFVFVPVLLAGGAWALIRWRRARSGKTHRTIDASALGRSVAGFGAAFMAVATAIALPAILGSIYTAGPANPQTADASSRNVYVLLLDGYPRGDTLDSVYGFDNGPFESALEGMDFRVSDQSRSNYPHTWLTLTSLLSGSYLEDIPDLNPPPDAAEEQYRVLMDALNAAPMASEFRDRGYEVVAIPSPFHSVALQTADRVLDSGQINAFEYSLLMHSQLAPLITRGVPDFLMSQQRDRFHATLDNLVQLSADSGERPRFVFAHLFSPPHAPLVYGSNGEHLPLPECVPSTCALWEFPDDAWDQLDDQIAYTNGQILTMLDALIRADPEATVILMSDHGSRRDRQDLDEFFRTLFAARSPGYSFPDDIDPVDVLRTVLDAHDDIPHQALPYRAWMFADEIRPLDLTPFEPMP